MKADIADRRRGGHPGEHANRFSRSNPFPPGLASRLARPARLALAFCLSAFFALGVGEVRAQDVSMLDDRVTQQSIGETICRPGYASAVSPPLDKLMAHKDRMLAERGLDADDGVDFALDRRVPVVLGGSPDAPSNLRLLPWAGRQGERRKARVAVMLKRCVCEGKLSLGQAQAAIVGDWSIVNSSFSQSSCDVSQPDAATPGEGARAAGHLSSP
ncbi:hypothetical protein VOM14_11515 [Paraburkholderia sp. MPAMCS5]|uniref:hypothetical protein n=1 Tax=Paraburkholderia sp. MPAMCS5 TaxID=3112563 RepID=UPI002E18112F|nr:hypothetical protein [Paraburkholderia sp. MPAMCS5]